MSRKVMIIRGMESENNDEQNVYYLLHIPNITCFLFFSLNFNVISRDQRLVSLCLWKSVCNVSDELLIGKAQIRATEPAWE